LFQAFAFSNATFVPLHAGARNERVHGAALTAELELFYSTVHQLFTRGNLGGVRIRAKKAAAA
jgi:hypothetical protein